MTTIAPTAGKPGTIPARSVTLRSLGTHHEIATTDVVVTPVETDLEAIQCAGHTLGYVQRAGAVFVSLVGERADRAEECGQYLKWDVAAARLTSYCSHT